MVEVDAADARLAELEAPVAAHDGRLHGQDSAPRRHHVVEVPPLSVIVTEYRSTRFHCLGW
jgi:hypothetical protein